MSEFKTLPNPFQFSTHDVRTTINEAGDVFFCAKDVCLALEITWSGASKTLGNMPTTWQGTFFEKTPGGVQEMVFINEAALYKLIFRSNKPAAEQFANWVCEEVLPSIRKHGHFGAFNSKERLAYSKQIVEITSRMTETKDAMLFKLLADELRDLCNLIGRTMPDLSLLGRDYKQLDLFLNLPQQGA